MSGADGVENAWNTRGSAPTSRGDGPWTVGYWKHQSALDAVWSSFRSLQDSVIRWHQHIQGKVHQLVALSYGNCVVLLIQPSDVLRVDVRLSHLAVPEQG